MNLYIDKIYEWINNDNIIKFKSLNFSIIYYYSYIYNNNFEPTQYSILYIEF